ncbi:MAG TPA: hypothetical protein VHM26_13440 [Chitinophagaceae bacterium]|jgi:hypothetical protein|nr:hypothetical protein [Chitinophagaceae bacterium]
MFLALFSTGCTYIRTKLADRIGMITFQVHILNGRFTNSTAFKIELNATHKHMNMFFFQTGSRAMIAGICATEAGFYAGLICYYHRP